MPVEVVAVVEVTLPQELLVAVEIPVLEQEVRLHQQDNQIILIIF
jgi:hypothetical protein